MSAAVSPVMRSTSRPSRMWTVVGKMSTLVDVWHCCDLPNPRAATAADLAQTVTRATVGRLGADGFRSVGSYGWGGAYGSSYTVDPAERLVIVFMLQQIPNSSNVAGRFATLVYQALVPGGR